MEQLTERAFTAFGEEARRRAIDYRSDIRARPVIVTDGDRVLQIISNLLSNAFRWTPEGGRVELSLSEDDAWISVVVSDSGPGIPKDELERIFDTGVRLDPERPGIGIGLALARSIAEGHGGTLTVESRLGRGTVFTLSLPLHDR